MKLKGIGIGVFLLLASLAQADMIQDGPLDTLYEAAWVESNDRGCSEACRKEGIAEHEALESSKFSVKRAYVCKAELERPDLKGELYGTNLLTEKYRSYCFILGPNSEPIHQERFKCLCVR